MDKDEIINDLLLKLNSQKKVLEGEKLLTHNYKEIIKQQELLLEILNNTVDDLTKKITKLQFFLEKKSIL
jgi:hypothetical protein